jgi:hypothetical protein
MKLKEEDLDLDQVNRSELVEICHWAGIASASRAWPRELLVQSLKEFNDPDITNPIDLKREKMEVFQQKYWDRIRMQAPKKVCPKCHECRDLQVLACYDLNRAYFE